MGYKDLTAERGLTGLKRQKAVGENVKIINMDITITINQELIAAPLNFMEWLNIVNLIVAFILHLLSSSYAVVICF